MPNRAAQIRRAYEFLAEVRDTLLGAGVPVARVLVGTGRRRTRRPVGQPAPAWSACRVKVAEGFRKVA